MDIPLIDKSRGDAESQLDPMEQLKPLQWSALEVRNVELRSKLEQASEQLNRAIKRQKSCNARIRKTVDIIMSYGSRFSQHKEEREALIREIEAMRFDGDFDDEVAEPKAEVENVVAEIVDKICFGEGKFLQSKNDSFTSDKADAHGDIAGDVIKPSRRKFDLELDQRNLRKKM